MQAQDNDIEPQQSPTFLVGQDAEGRWIVREAQGLAGGIFVSRAEALKYARFEGARRDRIIVSPKQLDFVAR